MFENNVNSEKYLCFLHCLTACMWHSVLSLGEMVCAWLKMVLLPCYRYKAMIADCVLRNIEVNQSVW